VAGRPAATAPASVDDRLVWVGDLPGDVPVSIMIGYRHDAEVCYRDAGYTVEVGAPLTIDIDPVGDALRVQVLSIQRGSEIADVFTWLIEPETGRSVGDPSWRDRLARIAVQWRRLLAHSLVSDLLQVKVMIARPDVRVDGQPDRWRNWLRAVHRAARQCAAVPRP